MLLDTWLLLFVVLCVPFVCGLETYWSMNTLMMGPKAHHAFVDSVAMGARKGVTECKVQFQWDKWNCPVSDLPVFSADDHAEATREVAFLHSISSAGVVHSLARNCSLGHFNRCSCDDSRKGEKGGPTWIWGGCSDNVKFGEKIAKVFVDSLVTGKDARATVKLHNNQAGRWAVRRTMKLICKCHGVSGSCTTKTCWQQLSSFRSIGVYLKRKYVRAFNVDFQNGALHQTTRRRGTRAGVARIKNTDLVYLNASPDYCKRNGSVNGMVGRQCIRPPDRESASREERKSCPNLCRSCGLNVRKRSITVKTSCLCQFHWCCAVRCQICEEKKAVLTCAL